MVYHKSLRAFFQAPLHFLEHENPKTADKIGQKRSENFKPCIHSFVSTGMNFTKIWLSMCANGKVMW